MNIIKLAQSQQPANADEIMQAVSTLNQTTAVINKNIEELQASGVLELFKKENLTAAIQSGNTAALDPNKVNHALGNMGNISQSVLILDRAMRTLRDNDASAKMMNIEYNSVINGVIEAIQSGNYQGLTSNMANSQHNMSGASYTQSR